MEIQIKPQPVKKMKESAIQKIKPFLWFDDQAEAAVNLYTSIFKNSKIKNISRYNEESAKASGRIKGSVMTVDFQLEGEGFVAINGGPVFKITPTISFFVNCDTKQEIDFLWAKLSDGGNVMMELDKYPFSERYGWIQDKYGVSWQLIMPGRSPKIEPCFMFSGKHHKMAEEAINFYVSIFQNQSFSSGKSEIIQLERYGSDIGPEGAIVHSKFTLNGQEFIAMDSHEPIPYDFNPAISLVLNCETQDEIDYYWGKLTQGGDEQAQQCGWLQDKFGVSWQVVPVALGEMMSGTDLEKSGRVMQAILKMKKIDMNILKKVYNQQ